MANEPPRHLATGLSTAWTGDLTFVVCTSVAGKFFYLYVILDLWGRGIVASESGRPEGPSEAPGAARCIIRFENFV
jgi:hypothetical protein